MKLPKKTISIVMAAAALGAVAMFAAAQTPAPLASDALNNPFGKDAAAPAAGKRVFDTACAACHGPAAAGGRAPALDSGVFKHGGEDQEVFRSIQAGIQGTDMPAFSRLPSDDVWRVVAYLRSLSAQPASNVAVAGGDAAKGQALFFGAGNCTSCHEVNGRGADLASDLSAEGAKPAGAIKTGVLHQFPPARGRQVGPRFVSVATNDGRTLTGVARNEDAFFVQVETMDGKWTTLDRKDVKSVLPAPGAPTDIATRFASADVDNMTAYLATLKRRNLTETVKAQPASVLSAERLANAKAEPQNWLTYWGDYHSHHFSELTQITTSNVATLQARWSAPLPGGGIQSQPLVVDGVMYVTGTPGEVYAFDARTGLQKWAYVRQQEVKSPYQINPSNRGVAVIGGRVFFGTLDASLIALDAHTGRMLWEARVANSMDGQTITSAPLVIRNMVITGISGGEFGAPGFLDAYDVNTGKRLWRTNTVPQPGEPNNKTWAGESWKTGGAPTWLTGSYDPELDTLYWATGNPGPDYNADLRKGDNLYSNCVLALDPATGKIKWWYQFTPNDPHDWDATENNVLADQVIDGKPRKLILHADRNGFFYVLDRTNGKFLFAKPFVRANWNKGFDKNGRPILDPKAFATKEGQVVFPAVGGTNFQAPSYDAQSKLFYLQYQDGQGFAQSAPVTFEKGKQFLGQGSGPRPNPTTPNTQGVMAIDSATGNVAWKFPLARVSLASGVLGTRGGALFVASAEGQLIALDQKTGAPLWRFRTNGNVGSSPMSYAIDGKQYIAFTAANAVYAFALPQ